jgi:hypothetical protein
MTNEERELIEQWIIAFCEPPPIIDAELMRRLLAEQQPSARDPTMTDRTFQAGDRVKWRHSQGTTTGKVVRKVTSKTHIKGHTVAASPENPEYVSRAQRPAPARRTNLRG